MSKETYIGGDLIEWTGGSNKIYVQKGYTISSGGQIIFDAKGGEKYLKPDTAPDDDKVIMFTKTSLDLDGARGNYSPYTTDDEGTDKLANAYDNMNPGSGNEHLVGAVKDNHGNPYFQKDYPTAYVSGTSLAKDHTKLLSDPERYYDSENDNFVVLNPPLRDAGIKLGDWVVVKYNKISVDAIVADVGPMVTKHTVVVPDKNHKGKTKTITKGGYEPSTLEMSAHLLRNFETLRMEIPPGKNPHNHNKPYKNPKYSERYLVDITVEVSKKSKPKDKK